MTANPPAAGTTMTTGVTVVAATAISNDVVANVLRAVALAAGAARVDGADDETLGTLAFASGGEAAFAVVSRAALALADGRADLAALLEGRVRDVLRVDVMLHRGRPGAFVLADAALVRIAARLVDGARAVVVDHLGSVYDPAELVALAAEGLPRASAFSYRLGAARRAVAGEPLDVTPPPRAATVECEAPEHPAPDGTSAEGIVFAASGPHLPLVHLARIALALAGDARANPGRRSVALHAPNVAAAEGLRLAAMGVAVRLRPADSAATLATRDEIDVLALAGLTVAEAIATVERTAGEAHGGAATTSPEAATSNATAGFPHRIATFAVAGAEVAVYHLDLERADPVFATFVRARRDLALLLGGAPAVAIAIEISATTSGSAGAVGSRAADAFATALAAAFVARGDALAADAGGAVYGARELASLAERREGRAGSWSARVALALGAATA